MILAHTAASANIPSQFAPDQTLLVGSDPAHNARVPLLRGRAVV